MAGPFANGLEWANDEMDLAEGESKVNQMILSALPQLLNTLSKGTGGAIPDSNFLSRADEAADLAGNAGGRNRIEKGKDRVSNIKQVMMEALPFEDLNSIDKLNQGADDVLFYGDRGLRKVPFVAPLESFAVEQFTDGPYEKGSGYLDPKKREAYLSGRQAENAGPGPAAKSASPDVAQALEEIIRGPGPDGSYRVGGNQRFENTRGAFSRSNQSIGERLAQEKQYDTENSDNILGLVSQILKTSGAMPDEKGMDEIRNFASEQAASHLPRSARANFQVGKGPVQAVDNTGNDAEGNTQLAMTAAIMAGLVDQFAFKGAGRKALGGALGKIPGLGRFAGKGAAAAEGATAAEAKAVASAAKANGVETLKKKVSSVGPEVFKRPNQVRDLSSLDSGVKTSSGVKASDRLKAAKPEAKKTTILDRRKAQAKKKNKKLK